MVSHGRVELLAHPLSQKYLQMKWNSYGKYFHVTNLFIYSVFLMFVTLYSSQLMTNVIKDNPKLGNGTEVRMIEGRSGWNTFLHNFFFAIFSYQTSSMKASHQHPYNLVIKRNTLAPPAKQRLSHSTRSK